MYNEQTKITLILPLSWTSDQLICLMLELSSTGSERSKVHQNQPEYYTYLQIGYF